MSTAIIFFSILTFIGSFSLCFGAEKEIKSKITGVTVYADRAQVTRVGKINLAPGTHQILFAGLPDDIDRNALRVNGTGNGTIQDIEYFRKHSEEIQDDKLKKLTDQKERLQDSIDVFRDKIKQSKSETAFVEAIIKKLTTVPEKDAAPAELNPEKWIKMVSYYRSKLSAASQEQRLLKKAIERTNKKIRKITREVSDLNHRASKMTTGIKVNILVSKQGPIHLTAQYITFSVKWHPSYDIRVSTNEQKLRLTYKAKISQNSNEDWKKVALNISTAMPSISGNIPEFTPWYVDIHRPQPRPSRARMSKEAMAAPPAPSMEMADMEMLREKSDQFQGMSTDVANVMAKPEAVVKSGATSVLYGIQGKSTIISDNREHTVQITEVDLNTELKYATIPKLSPHVYLTAEAVNETEFAFLRGQANIYLDDQYVSRIQLDQVSPTEKFETSLGADAGVSAKRKLIKRFHSKEGVFSKQNNQIYKYQIKLKSTKNKPIKLTLWDQVPISNDKKIEVQIITPKDIGKAKHININDFQYIKWTLALEPNKEKEIPFSFSVSWPKGKSITGL